MTDWDADPVGAANRFFGPCEVTNLDSGRTIALFRNTQMILPRRDG